MAISQGWCTPRISLKPGSMALLWHHTGSPSDVTSSCTSCQSCGLPARAVSSLNMAAFMSLESSGLPKDSSLSSSSLLGSAGQAVDVLRADKVLLNGNPEADLLAGGAEVTGTFGRV